MATVQKNENGNLTVRFRNGYEAEFKQPGELILAQSLANVRRDPNKAVDVLIDQCLVKGDKKLLKDSVAYLVQIQEVADDLFGKVTATITWQDNLATIEFLDGKMCILKPADRNVYGDAQAKARQNPLNYVRHILNACWQEGDEDIRKSAGHLLGFTEIQAEFLEYTGEKLGN